MRFSFPLFYVCLLTGWNLPALKVSLSRYKAKGLVVGKLDKKGRYGDWQLDINDILFINRKKKEKIEIKKLEEIFEIPYAKCRVKKIKDDESKYAFLAMIEMPDFDDKSKREMLLEKLLSGEISERQIKSLMLGKEIVTRNDKGREHTKKAT